MPISFDGKSGSFGECVAHFTKKGKSSDSAHKICGTIQARQEKEMTSEHKFCGFGKIQIKEDEKDFHVSGFVATSHPDRAEANGFAGDIIPKSTLQKITEQLNNRYKPEAGAVSYRHDWIKDNNPNLPLAGAIAEPAVLKQTEDNEWGVFVDTVVSKTHPNYNNIKTEIEQGIIPGFSIEYVGKGQIPVEKEGKKYRMLTDIDMLGFGFANRRMIANPHAEIIDFGYKEIFGLKEHHGDEEYSMEECPECKKKVREDKMSEHKKEHKGEKEMEQTNVQEKKEAATAAVEVKQYNVSAEDMTLLAQFKEQKEKESKVKEMISVLTPSIKEQVAAEVKELRKRSMPGVNTGSDSAEFKELKEYKESLETKERYETMNWEARQSKHQYSVRVQYKEAAKLMNKIHSMGALYMGSGFANGVALPKYPEMKEVSYVDDGEFRHGEFLNPFGEMQVKERIEVKGLDTASNAGTQTDTNLASASWTYGSYFQAPVEFNDIFQPVIVNQLNDRNTTWGTLQKEDWSGYYQIAFRARTGRNSTAAGYTEGTNYVYGTDFSGQVGYDKFVQPFSYYGVRVAVTGQKMALARAPGGIGDVWAEEIRWSTQDLLRTLDLAVIGTGAGTSESTSLGFEGLFLGTTGTLYGKSLATYATLRSHTKVQTTRVDLNELRLMIERVQTGTGSGSSEVISNADVSNLALFMHPLQERFIKGLIQDMQRIVPLSAKVGFEGRVEIDTVPIVTDQRMNTDDIFLIDTSVTKIGVNLPPTVMPLPVTADAQAALIKIYWNLYSSQPGNNFWSSGFSTT